MAELKPNCSEKSPGDEEIDEVGNGANAVGLEILLLLLSAISSSGAFMVNAARFSLSILFLMSLSLFWRELGGVSLDGWYL